MHKRPDTNNITSITNITNFRCDTITSFQCCDLSFQRIYQLAVRDIGIGIALALLSDGGMALELQPAANTIQRSKPGNQETGKPDCRLWIVDCRLSIVEWHTFS
jgi:hypothetical protein